jgi:stage V sporulation protein D (sporulation-specific penicillin-binding protein)
MPDLEGMTAKEAEKQLKTLGLTMKRMGSSDTVTAQIPAAGQTLPGGSQVLVYLGAKPETVTVQVPDFTGMTRQEASDSAGKLGLYILVSGNQSLEKNVTVTGQSVTAGARVPVGTTVILEFTDTKIRD